jgi:hypothetical protein
LAKAGPLSSFDESDPALDGLLEALEGNPRAIELAAARLAVWRPAELLARLRTDRRGALHAGAGPQTGADDWWDDLSPSEQALLAALTVFPDSFTPADAAAAAAMPEDQAERLLTALRNRFLATAGGRGLRLPHGVRAVAEPTRPPDVEDRWAEHLAARAEAAGARWAAEQGVDAFREIGELLPDILAVHRRVRAARPELAARLGAAVGRPVQLHERIPLARELVHGEWAFSARIPQALQGALALVAVEGLTGSGQPVEARARLAAVDPATLPPALGLRLRAYQARLDMRAGALGALDEIVDEAERIGDPTLLGELFTDRGTALYDRGRDAEAATDLARSAEILPARALSSRIALENITGIVCSRGGDMIGAEDHFRRARRLAEQAGMVASAAKAGKNLAICVALQRRFDEAAVLFEEYDRASTALGDDFGQLNLLGNRIEALLCAGRVADAEQLLAARGGAIEQTGDAEYLSWFEALRGELDLWHGRLGLAEARFRRAAAVAREGREHQIHTGAMCLLAAALADQDRLAEAKQVLAAVAVGDRPALAQHLALSRLHVDLGRVRRGDAGARERVLAAFDALRPGLDVEAEFRAAVFARRLAALDQRPT